MRGIRMEMEIIRHRRLLWELVKRDLRLRYIGSIMGLFWSVINPLILLVIYIFIFSLIFGGASSGGPAADVKRTMASFPVFLCCGVLPWNALMESLLAATGIISGSGGLIKKAVFPVAILPMQAIVASFVNFAITLVLFGVFLLGADVFFATNVFPGLAFAMVVPLAVLQLIVLVGACYFFATVNVFFRDMAPILNAMMMVMFWLTPMVYPAWLVTDQYPPVKYFYIVNPFAHLVRLYREFLYRGHPPQGFGEFGVACPIGVSVLYLLAIGALAYIVGKYVFTRSQPHFVDEV